MGWPTASGKSFYLKELQPLVGLKVVSTVYRWFNDDGDDYDIFLGLVFDNGKILWLLSDDEGNQGGSFEITEIE